MSQRFYTSLPLHAGTVEVTGPEAHHLATVCRLRRGDAVRLFNGDGREYSARVGKVMRKAVQLEVLGAEKPARELSFALEVAAPLPKGDRALFLIEKLTELGVTLFIPLSCARSVVHPGAGKREKLHRHVIEASKQCGRNVLMQISDLVEWESYCRRAAPGEICMLAHPGECSSLAPREAASSRGARGLHSVPPLALAGASPVSVVRAAVGPEGGFTEAEVALARGRGWQLIDLGPRILRIETAALALAAQIVATDAQSLGSEKPT
jgi:16S rRNA (uracil1498-N3)-methyltransferase